MFAYLLLTSSAFKGYPSKGDNFCCDLTIVVMLRQLTRNPCVTVA